MPSHTNTGTVSARPEQPLGSVPPQTGPGPGPAGHPGPQAQTPLDASTRGKQRAAPTQANQGPHPHHSPPVRQTEGPTHAPSEGTPTQTCTATPTDATSARPKRPLGTMRPQAHIPTASPSRQAPDTPSTSAPGYNPPAPAQAEPAAQQRHDPPAGPAVQPTETPSGSHPAPRPDPDPAQATVPADDPRANAQGRELPMGVRHPEVGTPAARPAAAEGNGGTRALAGHEVGQPRPAPAPDGENPSGDANGRRRSRNSARTARPATTPGAHGKRQGGSGGPPQRKEAPLPAADLPARGPAREEIPSGVTGQPKKQHTSVPANQPPVTGARESGEVPDAAQPSTGPGGPKPDAEHAAAPPPPYNHPRGADRG